MKNEAYVHIAVRRFLRKEGWTLVAGEFPGGSDDELHVLSIMDPLLARDNSPDHRRHSSGEIIPDLIAIKDDTLIIIEAKPKYSESDKTKLTALLSERREDLLKTLNNFLLRHKLSHFLPLTKFRFIPCLAFLKQRTEHPHVPGFWIFEVTDLDSVTLNTYDNETEVVK
jgi:Holliday junction resolvase-like predicted endonuclease